MKVAYPYYRVSTRRQGRSGLGLLAQQQAVESYAKGNGFTLGKAYIEIESGRSNHRPQLERALKTCKANHSLLLIAQLDRLSRNVAFITALMETEVSFVAVDNPNATRFVLHILAAVAQYEAEQTSIRTKEALKVARSRGVELGSFGRQVLADRNRQRSKSFAMRMKLTIYKLRKEGFATVRAITKELNRRQIPTYFNRGQRWHIGTVQRLLRTLQLNI